jgi:hypothetical protein
LVSEIENSQLNSTEVQQLIDVLLVRQNDNEQWHKVGTLLSIDGYLFL